MTELETMYERLDQHIEQRMREARTAGLALALFDRDDVLHVSMHGFRNLETRDPVTPDTLFEIGSVSKTFTAVAVLQAMEQGLLDRHAPVDEYLPWFQVRSRHAPITIHHLLSHSAGIIATMDMSPDARGAVWSLRDVETGFAPGEWFHYSEVGYQALTLVLETVHRRPYADVVRAGILEPLGMTDTTAVITHAIRPRLARGYQTLYDDRPPHASHPLVPAPWLEMGSGDGGIASTAGDMACLGRMLLNHGRGPGGPILSEESYRLMTTPVIAEAEYGYGIYAFESDGAAHIGHGGDMPGYDAYLWLDTDHGLGIALLVAHPYPSGLSWQVLDLFRADVLGRPLPDLTPADPAHVENAADFAGTYRAADRAVTLVAEGNRLLLEHGGERITLEGRGHDRFYVNHPDFDHFLLRFGRPDDGHVVEAYHGPDWYLGDATTGPRDFPYPAEWDAYPGHYRAHNPWASNFRVVVRKAALLLIRPAGDEEPLTPLGDGEFWLGEEAWSPERLRFDQIADGQALRATLSGCHYYRFFTP